MKEREGEYIHVCVYTHTHTRQGNVILNCNKLAQEFSEQVAVVTEERDNLAKEDAVSADLEAELKKLRERCQLLVLTEETRVATLV